jgi:hypothetical protein
MGVPYLQHLGNAIARFCKDDFHITGHCCRMWEVVAWASRLHQTDESSVLDDGEGSGTLSDPAYNFSSASGLGEVI